MGDKWLHGRRERGLQTKSNGAQHARKHTLGLWLDKNRNDEALEVRTDTSESPGSSQELL